MTSGHLLQTLLVGLVLAWSLLQVVKKLLPGTFRALQNRLAQTANRHGWGRLGRWLQSGESGAGCGSGCDSCGTCGSEAAPTAGDATQAVKLQGKMADSSHKPQR